MAHIFIELKKVLISGKILIAGFLAFASSIQFQTEAKPFLYPSQSCGFFREKSNTSEMALDNVSFLIMWFLVMFITLSTGILVIMYRVGCFKCNKKIGIGDLHTSLQKLMHPQHGPQDAEAQQQQDSTTLQRQTPEPGSSSQNLQMQQRPRVLVRQTTDKSEGPNKLCTVCGEPMGTEYDPGESSHPACRDMDVSFF